MSAKNDPFTFLGLSLYEIVGQNGESQFVLGGGIICDSRAEAEKLAQLWISFDDDTQ